MAYSTITDGEIDTDSALTTTLMRKYRDNLDAVLDGDENAPRLDSKGLGLTRSINNGVVTDAGGNTVASIDIGDSRWQVINVQCSIRAYGDSDFLNRVNATTVCVGSSYRLSTDAGLTTGNSDVLLQASNDGSSWVTIDTIASYEFVSSGGDEFANLTINNNIIRRWDMRYYRIYATGDGDHELEGDFHLIAIGE